MARFADIATFATIIALFSISPMLLQANGIAYSAAGGGLFSKVHPATILAVLALSLRCLAHSQPTRTAWAMLVSDPGLVTFTLSIIVAASFAIVVDKTPVTPLVDTFVLAILVFLLIGQLGQKAKTWLSSVVSALLIINSMIAIYEYVDGSHLITLDTYGMTGDPTKANEVFSWPANMASDWRPEGLLGHPLVNGLITGSYVMCLAASGSSWIGLRSRLLQGCIPALSLLVFGARVALVLSAFFASCLIASALLNAYRGGARLTARATISLSLAVIIVAAGLFLLWSTGFADKALERFVSDGGSASTRLTTFSLLDAISWSDLFLHPDKDVVATLQRVFGLEFGIESSWVGLILTYGVLVTAILVTGLLAFWRSVLRLSGRGAAAVCIFYLISVSVTANLTGKTTTLAMAVCLIAIYLRKDAQTASSERIIIDAPANGVQQMQYLRNDPRSMSEAPNIVRRVWRRKLTILSSILACLCLGLLYIYLTPSRYSATAAMLIDPRLGRTVGSDPNVPGFVADTAMIDSQIKLFTSQTVLARAALATDLKNDPEFNGTDRSLLQRVLYPSFVVSDGIDLKALQDAISIKRPERTYVVEISVLARDNKKAAAIANAIAAAYIADQIDSRVDAAQRDTVFVSSKLDRLSGEIRKLDDRIEAYKAANKIIDAGGLRSDEQQVADLTKALSDVRAKKSDIEARLLEIGRLAQEGRLDVASDALKSPTIESLRRQQAESEANAARLSMTLGGHHPEMIEVRKRQARLAEMIQEELSRVKEGLESEFTAATNNEKQVLTEIDTVKTHSAEASRTLVTLDQMQRNRAVLRSSFDRFAQVNDALAQQGAQSPPGRVIAIAQPAISPSRPRKAVVSLVALSFGAFFGFAGVVYTEGDHDRPLEGGEKIPAASQIYQRSGKRRRRRQTAKFSAVQRCV